MPHKDREARLEYLRAWKARNRRAPQFKSQPDGLPPIGAMSFSQDGTKVQCHACGRWFGSLNMHLKMHGHDARSYKEAYGLPRTSSLLPPVTAQKQREAALERDQGALGRLHLSPTEGRPVGVENRLATRVSASDQRRGIYTRGGNKTRGQDDPETD